MFCHCVETGCLPPWIVPVRPPFLYPKP